LKQDDALAVQAPVVSLPLLEGGVRSQRSTRSWCWGSASPQQTGGRKRRV